jgi:hypothetical protein
VVALELLFVVVGIVIVVWFLASRSRRNLERAQDPANWEYDEPVGDFMVIRYRVSFPSMVMIRHATTVGRPGVDTEKMYTVRRGQDGRWEERMSDESYRAEVADLTERVRDGDDMHLGRLQSLQHDGNVWVGVGEELAPRIERAYRRYIRRRAM